MQPVRILAFAGSLRERSFNRALLVNSQRLAPEGMEIAIHDLREIPLYNMDDESHFPASVVAFKDAIRAADGVLIATPEHNFSFPGVLKNALDWASRPPSDGVFADKPVILQSASTGWAGGLRAQLALKQVLGFFPMRVMHFPEVVVGAGHTKFDEDLNLTDELALGNVRTQLAAFREFILAGRH